MNVTIVPVCEYSYCDSTAEQVIHAVVVQVTVWLKTTQAAEKEDCCSAAARATVLEVDDRMFDKELLKLQLARLRGAG